MRKKIGWCVFHLEKVPCDGCWPDVPGIKTAASVQAADSNTKVLDGYLEDQPWLTSPLRIGLLSFQMAISWLINGGDPNHLLTGMILQVADDPCRPEKVLPGSRLPFR